MFWYSISSMNPFCWWQLAFASGVALGFLGVVFIIRCVLYMLMASHVAEILYHSEAFFRSYRRRPSEPVHDGLRSELESLVRYIREYCTRLDSLAKWIWPATTEARFRLQSAEVLAEEFDYLKSAVALELIRAGVERRQFANRWEPSFSGRLGSLRNTAELFRSSATICAIWAASCFASASLVVGLFALWEAR